MSENLNLFGDVPDVETTTIESTTETPQPVEKKGKKRGKSAHAYRTISEVAADLDVATHVLRFWETRFPEIKPMKRAGGRRYYRPQDVELLHRIKELLYDDGYTIRGVQTYLKKESKGAKSVKVGAKVEEKSAKASGTVPKELMDAVLSELRDMRAMLTA